MSLASQISALATRVATEIKAVRSEVTSGLSGKVATSRTISTTSPLTGGGDLSANRTLAVTTGTSAGTVALGDHTHADVPTSRTISTTSPLTGGGDLSANRTLAVTTGTSSGTVATGDHTHSGYVPTTQRAAIGGGSSDSGSGTWAPDAAAYSVWRYVATGNLAVSLPTGGVDAQTLRLWFLASGADRVITFNGSYEVTQSVPGRVFTVPDGTWASVLVECRTTTWVLVAAYPQAVTAATPATQSTSGSVSVSCETNGKHAITMTGNVTAFSVTGTPYDGQQVLVELYASGGTRTFTTSLTNLTSRTLPLSVASGTAVLVGLYYSSRTSAWSLAAVGAP